MTGTSGGSATRGPDTVTFEAHLVAVRRRGLTEFEYEGRDLDHGAVLAIPEWSHDRFALGDRVRVTVSRLDAVEGEDPMAEFAAWLDGAEDELPAAMASQLRGILHRARAAAEDEVAYALAQAANDQMGREGR